MCWNMMLGFAPFGNGMGAAGANCAFACRFCCRISFCVGGCRDDIGTAMPKGVLGLSTALSGLFSYTCAFPPSILTFSLLFCLLRENVDMESAGRPALAPALGAFSGEYVSARVADGVLLCEDVLVPAEVFVRSEALRDRRSDEPMSVTELAIECLLACLRFCGVVGTFDGCSYWLGTRGGASAGGRLSAGGVVLLVVRDCERVDEDCLWCPLVDFPPKKEGRREKRPVELVVLDVWSAMFVLRALALYRSPTAVETKIQGNAGGLIRGSLPTWRGVGCNCHDAMQEVYLGDMIVL